MPIKLFVPVILFCFTQSALAGILIVDDDYNGIFPTSACEQVLGARYSTSPETIIENDATNGLFNLFNPPPHTVRICPGTYTVNEINVNNNAHIGMTVEGTTGNSADIIIQENGSNGTIFDVREDGVTIQDISMQNAQYFVDTNAGSDNLSLINLILSNNTVDDAIRLRTPNNTLRDINISNVFRDGIRADIPATNTSLENIVIDNAGDDCIEMYSDIINATNLNLSNCTDFGFLAYASNGGTPGTIAVLNDVSINTTGDMGLQLRNYTAGNIQGNNINVSQHENYGIYLFDIDGGAFTNLNASNGVLGPSGTPYDGLYVRQTTNTSFTNVVTTFNTDDGVEILDSDNNQFTNIDASNNADLGLTATAANSSSFTNFSSNNNGDDGFNFTRSNNNVMDNMSADQNSDHGFILSFSGSNNISNSSFTNNIDEGLYMLNLSNDNVLDNITATGNQSPTNDTMGLYLLASTGNTISNSNFSNNNFGILINDGSVSGTLTRPSDNIFNNVTANNNLVNGLRTFSSDNNQFSNLTMSNNANVGIQLSDSNFNTFTDTTLENNGNDGLALGQSNNNEFTNTRAFQNLDHGIVISRSSSNTFTNANAISNTDHGIYINTQSNNNILQTISSNNHNNTTVNIDPIGLYILASNNNTITDATLTGNDDGLWINDSTVDGAVVRPTNNILNNVLISDSVDTGMLIADADNSIFNTLTINNTGRNAINVINTSAGNVFNDVDIDTTGINGTGNGLVFTSTVSNNTINTMTTNNVERDALTFTSNANNNTANNITAINSGRNAFTFTTNASSNILNNINSQNSTQHGMIFTSTTNSNTINNFTSTNDTLNGVIISGTSNNNNLNNLTITNAGDDGIELSSNSNNNTIDVFNITNSTVRGIYILRSDNNTISNGSVNNGADGISLTAEADNNTFDNVSINNVGDDGFQIARSNNNIFRNGLIDNSNDYGIILNGNNNSALGSTNNVFTNNTISNSGNDGLQIFSNGTTLNVDNVFSNNCFFNTSNIDDDEISGANIYDQTLTGNFYGSVPLGTGYSDTCIDANGNRRCDVSYPIPGASSNIDNFPLTVCGSTEADVQVNKSSQIIFDPVNNATNPKAISGAIVRYTVELQNVSSRANANTVIITDDLDDLITTSNTFNWQAGSMNITAPGISAGATTNLSDATGDDEGEFNNTAGNRTVTARCGTLLSFQTCTLTFEVELQ